MIALIVRNVPVTTPASQLWALASPLDGLTSIARINRHSWLLNYESEMQANVAMVLPDGLQVDGNQLVVHERKCTVVPS